MNTFRFFWNTHKYTGLTIALIVVVTAVTGILLLLKKEFDWIQPPTQKGQEGPIEAFISFERVWQSVAREQHSDFKTPQDIDRIDLRPDKHVFKVRSKHNHTEIQVCATTGRVLSVDVRRSDLIEKIHDGSWIGEPFHDFVMPLFALALLFLVFSGSWMWLEPIVKRRRRKRLDRQRAAAERS